MSENKNILNLVSQETFVEKMGALTDAVTEKTQLKPRVEELEHVINGDDSTPGIVTTLENKVDKQEGKDLSSNDFTDELVDKLNSIEAGAQVNPTLGSLAAKDVVTYGDLDADLKANLDDCVHDVVPEDSSINISDDGSTRKVSVNISKNVANTLSVTEDGLLNLPIAPPEYSIIRAADSGEYAATYHLTKDGENVGVAINIPRDIVVQSGSVVGDNIVLVLNDANSTEIKIPVASLIEYVTSGSQTTDPVVIHVSDDHKVTATLTDGSITFTKLDTDTQNRVVTIEDAVADIYTKIADSTKDHLYLHSVFVSYKHTKTTGDGQFQFSTILINSDSRPYTLTHNNGGSDWVQIEQEDAYDLYRFWKAVSQCQLNADGYPISSKEYPYMANGCLSLNFKTPLSIVQTIKTQLFKHSDGEWRRYLIVNGSGLNSTSLGSSVMQVSCGTPTMNANGQDIADIADVSDIPTSDLENYVGQDFYIVDTLAQLF